MNTLSVASHEKTLLIREIFFDGRDLPPDIIEMNHDNSTTKIYSSFWYLYPDITDPKDITKMAIAWFEVQSPIMASFIKRCGVYKPYPAKEFLPHLLMQILSLEIYVRIVIAIGNIDFTTTEFLNVFPNEVSLQRIGLKYHVSHLLMLVINECDSIQPTIMNQLNQLSYLRYVPTHAIIKAKFTNAVSLGLRAILKNISDSCEYYFYSKLSELYTNTPMLKNFHPWEALIFWYIEQNL